MLHLPVYFISCCAVYITDYVLLFGAMGSWLCSFNIYKDMLYLLLLLFCLFSLLTGWVVRVKLRGLLATFGCFLLLLLAYSAYFALDVYCLGVGEPIPPPLPISLLIYLSGGHVTSSDWSEYSHLIGQKKCCNLIGLKWSCDQNKAIWLAVEHWALIGQNISRLLIGCYL